MYLRHHGEDRQRLYRHFDIAPLSHFRRPPFVVFMHVVHAFYWQ
jgi:hypothetical protein